MVELTAGRAHVTIDEQHGGRIERLQVAGLELLVPPELDDRNHGAFPMAPWAGRVRHGRFGFEGVEHQLPLDKPPHAIHGTVRDARWRIERAESTSVVLGIALGEPWPFRGRVVQHASLTPHALTLGMEVHATEHPMPASCGWHPWWSRRLSRGDALELELHAGSMYERDEEGIPTGELVPIAPPPWDDCFTALHEPAAILSWPGAVTLELRTDCPCVVVYTEPEHAVCVEPQSGPPDALNLEPRVVAPGDPLVVHTTWEWDLAGKPQTVLSPSS